MCLEPSTAQKTSAPTRMSIAEDRADRLGTVVAEAGGRCRGRCKLRKLRTGTGYLRVLLYFELLTLRIPRVWVLRQYL
ncbi:unnamed protein product, partial [Iphiclides podalirius]